MATAAFKREDLIDLTDGNCEGLVSVENRITSTGRWSINHKMVFKEEATSKFYMVYYSRGATEQQDESPFEHEPDLVECAEVRPVERLVVVYEPVPVV